jgi:hypothetical protein
LYQVRSSRILTVIVETGQQRPNPNPECQLLRWNSRIGPQHIFERITTVPVHFRQDKNRISLDCHFERNGYINTMHFQNKCRSREAMKTETKDYHRRYYSDVAERAKKRQDYT